MTSNTPDARGAWNETGEKLTDLGRKLKLHYAEHRGEDTQQARQELADAARRVGSALQDAFEALGAAARDKEVQSDVKNVGHSLLDALGATLGQASDDVRRAFSERKGDVRARAAREEAPEQNQEPARDPAQEPAQEPSGDGEQPKVEPWGTP